MVNTAAFDIFNSLLEYTGLDVNILYLMDGSLTRH